MDDSENYGCILCPNPERRRLPHRPPVCEACRSWLAGLVGDIRILTEQLAIPEPAIQDLRVAPMLEPGWVAGRAVHDRRVARDEAGALVLRWRDPLGTFVPVGPIHGKPAGPQVAAHPGSHPPLPLGPIDLAAPARAGSLGPHTRGVLGLDVDQDGQLSLATVLQVWVRDWARLRDRGEGDPEPTVEVLCRWLSVRVDWACDDHPEIADFAADVRTYRSALRNVLGLSERPEYMKGVPCRECHWLALFRRIGSEWVECGNCPALLSPEEYVDWVSRARKDSPAAVAKAVERDAV